MVPEADRTSLSDWTIEALRNPVTVIKMFDDAPYKSNRARCGFNPDCARGIKSGLKLTYRLEAVAERLQSY